MYHEYPELSSTLKTFTGKLAHVLMSPRVETFCRAKKCPWYKKIASENNKDPAIRNLFNENVDNRKCTGGYYCFERMSPTHRGFYYISLLTIYFYPLFL